MDSKNFLTGQASKRAYTKYLITVLSLYFTLLCISMALNIKPFTWVGVCVSNLGNPGLNPAGYYFFTIAMVFGGIFLLPIFFFIYQNFFTVKRKINGLWIFFMILCSIGMAGVGIFNERMGPIHYVFAGLGFGGMGLVMFASITIAGRNALLKGDRRAKINYALLLCEVLLFSFLAIREVLIWGTAKASLLFLAEWYAFFLLFFWLIGSFLSTPAKKVLNP